MSCFMLSGMEQERTASVCKIFFTGAGRTRPSLNGTLIPLSYEQAGYSHGCRGTSTCWFYGVMVLWVYSSGAAAGGGCTHADDGAVDDPWVDVAHRLDIVPLVHPQVPHLGQPVGLRSHHHRPRTPCKTRGQSQYRGGSRNPSRISKDSGIFKKTSKKPLGVISMLSLYLWTGRFTVEGHQFGLSISMVGSFYR